MDYPFKITDRFVCKDPEYEITYEERTGSGTRRCVVSWQVDEIFVGSMESWDSSGEPMDAAARERVLDRLAGAYLSANHVRSICRADGVVLRLPGRYDVVLQHKSAIVRTPGRNAVFAAIELTARDAKPRALVLLDSCLAWTPARGPITSGERAELAEWLRRDPRVEVVDTAASVDPWTLARQLSEWHTLLLGITRSSQLVFEVAASRVEAPERTLFWLVELPALRHRGGGNNRPPWFRYGPIAVEGCKPVREWLFADPLPVAPNIQGGTDPQAESRLLVWAWAFARSRGVEPPGEIATRVLGIVLERGDRQGGAALAAYADGRVRYVAADTVVVCEPGLAPELAPRIAEALAHGQALVGDKPTGREHSTLAPDAMRFTALTCGGAHATLAPSAEVVQTCSALLTALIQVIGT